MPRKNFGKSVGITGLAVLVTPVSSTITIRTITVCNTLVANADVIFSLWYIDADVTNTPFYIARNFYLPWRSHISFDIGQVLEENDSLMAISDTASSIDVTGSYEV